jgi:hypothetical protein
MEQQPQPPQARNSSASTFAGMLAQNIVALLEELDQLKAEMARLRAEAQRQAAEAPRVPDKPPVPIRANGGAAA